MCGIVGYCGEKNPKDVILQGLKELEYRGYDSSGVAVLHKDKFKRLRAEGKLSALLEKVKGEEFDGRVGIGHTRWATHGVPAERNAHPHYVNGISIVHNGIIENYGEIRESLRKEGVVFESETDSEMIAHLIAREFEKEKDFLKAVQATIPQLKGAYAVLAVSEQTPDQIVAFKYGPPLILGVGENEFVVASDIQAIISHTKNVIYLEDNELVRIKGDIYEFYSSGGELVEKQSQLVDWTSSKVEKQGFDHYMMKEIFEQPRAVAAAMSPHIDLTQNQVRLSQLSQELSEEETQGLLKEVERIFIVACGTSFYAGMVGEYAIEKLARVPVEIDLASEFRYREPVIPKNSLVIVISQSGETADTLAVLRQVKESGAKTLSICNVKNSTIDRESDLHLYMNAGTEIGVASTKAFTATLAVLNLFSIYLAKLRDKIDLEKEKQFVGELLAVPSQMESVLAYDKFFAEAADSLKSYQGFLYLGRGVSFPVAMEGALKLKELAYMHAEGYAAGEMKHGPLALIDEKMAVVVIAPKDDVYEKTISNLEEAKARGGQVISIGTVHDERLANLSVHALSLPEASWMSTPLLSVIPVQLMSYHVARALGKDVDQPRNLAKSVTVE